MSRATFEQVYSALFALASGIPGITTSSRRLKNAQDVAPADSPAIYQVQGPQKAIYTENAPGIIWDITATWIVVVVDNDPTAAITPTLNPILDAITSALAPSRAQPRNTLGGLVETCAIEGNVEIFEGVIGDRAVAVVPIRLLLAGF